MVLWTQLWYFKETIKTLDLEKKKKKTLDSSPPQMYYWAAMPPYMYAYNILVNLFKIIHILSFFSCIQLFATLWTIACQAPLSMVFSRQKYWSELPCPPPGIKPSSLISPAFAGGLFTTSATWEAQITQVTIHRPKSWFLIPMLLLLVCFWVSYTKQCF